MTNGRDYGWYERTVRREVRGGIRARSKRGEFVSTWWGKRWIEVLESFQIGGRLARGRSYARSGQVADLEIESGKIRATVQGSRLTPYDVRIRLRALATVDWAEVARSILRRPVLVTKLLAGEMPEELEEVVRGLNLSLFPARSKDLRTSCSCPDWSNPCKHIAAVYYIIAEALDRDPFLLLKLRGLDRDRFVILLGGARPARSREVSPSPGPPPEPLPEDPRVFWGAPGPAPLDPEEARRPAVTAVLPRRLGPLPFWRGIEDLQQALSAIYEPASDVAEALLAGERPGENRGLGREIQ